MTTTRTFYAHSFDRDGEYWSVLDAEQFDALVNALKSARTMLNAYGSSFDLCHIALMDDIDAALNAATDARVVTSETLQSIQR